MSREEIISQVRQIYDGYLPLLIEEPLLEQSVNSIITNMEECEKYGDINYHLITAEVFFIQGYCMASILHVSNINYSKFWKAISKVYHDYCF